MNEQFRVAQKVGLMFRPETEIPEDIEGWAISQLHADSLALGISTKYGRVKSWPQSMQPNLEERAKLWRLYRENKKKERERKDFDKDISNLIVSYDSGRHSNLGLELAHAISNDYNSKIRVVRGITDRKSVV